MNPELKNFLPTDRVAPMSFQIPRPLAMVFAIALLFWSLGCAQETPESTGPVTGGQDSNMTVSGYMRSGVMFSGH